MSCSCDVCVFKCWVGDVSVVGVIVCCISFCGICGWLFMGSRVVFCDDGFVIFSVGCNKVAGACAAIGVVAASVTVVGEVDAM